MTSFNQAAADRAALAKYLRGDRDDGVRVGQIAGVAGAVIGAAACVSQGSSLASGIVGGLGGAVAGYAVGTLWGAAEINTTGKIISGTMSGLFGAGVASTVCSIVDCFVNEPK
jgi:hypothetical protein